MTIGRWIEFGVLFTKTLREGSEIPDELKKDVAKVAGDIAKAETLRDFLKGYIEVAEMDFRLRNAPFDFDESVFVELNRQMRALGFTGLKGA